MLVAPNARWRCSSQLSPSTGVTTCAYPDTDSSKRRRTPTAYDPIVDFLFVVRSIIVLLGLVVSGCLFAVVRRPLYVVVAWPRPGLSLGLVFPEVRTTSATRP